MGPQIHFALLVRLPIRSKVPRFLRQFLLQMSADEIAEAGARLNFNGRRTRRDTNIFLKFIELSACVSQKIVGLRVAAPHQSSIDSAVRLIEFKKRILDRLNSILALLN
jgi:hypothetical protein